MELVKLHFKCGLHIFANIKLVNMKTYGIGDKFTITVLIICLVSGFQLIAQNRDVNLTIHLRGVTETKISLMGLSGTKAFKTIVEVQGIKNGETTTMKVPKEHLPGEFVLRFDYKEKKESTPYPSEKNIIINDQDLELWVSPMQANNPDSTRLQKGERENAAFTLFMKDNGRQKEKLGLLQQFLANYDDTKSKFYQQGTDEYEKRREAYNQWLDARVKEDRKLFVSSLYRFQYVPEIPWTGSEKERAFSVISHYFDGIDFSDPVITKTSQMNEWMNSYVNLHMQMAITTALRDSLVASAARNAVEKAKSGSPVVYGWMVDYFFRGFESNNLPEGMKVLQPYLDDPNCLTSKRMEIERRLKGMETLLKGSKAPDIALKDQADNLFDLYQFNPGSPYILLLFWSADCSHCTETVKAISPWLELSENQQKISVVAISLDETETEINSWKKKITELSGWKHLRAADGVRSKVASDYYILATPVMILLNGNTKEIIALPNNLNDLMVSVKL
jgi:thioredoxin-related protein